LRYKPVKPFLQPHSSPPQSILNFYKAVHLKFSRA
jgi:hypothetical protein